MNQPPAFAPDTTAMRAMRVTAPGQVRMEEMPLPVPADGEVLVRLEGCGVCASNLEPWAGPDWMNYPTDPGGMGHEGWGRVEALGAGVTGLSLGQRVTFLGQCGYATHEVVDAARVIALPDRISGPFPGEAFGCVMNIFLRSGIRAGDRVAIIGVGFLGAALTRLASNVGADVIAISRRDTSLALARQMGAARTIPMEDHHAIIHEVAELTDHRFCDVVIEAVGKQWPLDLAGEIVAEGGRLVIAGYHQDGPRQVNMQNWNWRGIDVINAHERSLDKCLNGVHEAIKAIEAGRLDPGPLLTHMFPLEALDQALDATRDKPDGLVKAWVACA
ncbi:MDR/zinc-dependent alcohol dehydrogenase-like family protein [Falsirhodobacter sp. 20TX0035]|uniref:MDR/zinc-dependent alcohol dehydrogenase-like family protein n=1 Tax=Falsirhodobacter sp. 20TX0035 TaxID=3022019 RepID=UPI00232B4318|nr:zinc-binding dehydrogenase [Falsirhodobacter sp. 20TX0035]MDB6453743.1 zinc-binding dehydrogenase [Falsirhodobacter sp. 20TX0035]